MQRVHSTLHVLSVIELLLGVVGAVALLAYVAGGEGATPATFMIVTCIILVGAGLTGLAGVRKPERMGSYSLGVLMCAILLMIAAIMFSAMDAASAVFTPYLALTLVGLVICVCIFMIMRKDKNDDSRNNRR